MLIFKKSIPRRSVLKGLGASIAMPLLDAMVPALAKPAETFKAPHRLAIVFVPNGMWPMDKWTPKAEGPLEITPTLEPLTAFRDRLVMVSGLAQKEALPQPGDPTSEHMRASGTFLTGVRPKQIKGEAHGGVSVDQLAAQQLGKDTQLASLEMSMMANHDLVGVCQNNLSCLFVNTLCWKNSTTALPMATNPRTVFERLFGDVDTTDRQEQLVRLREQKSVLDGMKQRAGSLIDKMGAADRARLDEYVDSIRDIERRIQIAEAQSDRELPKLQRPAGVPANFDDYYKMMVDLQVVAYQADLTRVMTFMMGREGPDGGLAYPHIGVPDVHHNISHHGGDPVKVEKLFRINQYHAANFGYFLQKLQSVREGEGTLLDHAVILYGSSLANANVHQDDNLPILLAGGANGRLKGGRHVRVPDRTPLTNLHLALLDMVDAPVDKLGDSAGKLDQIFA
ncbi:MAG TPA: DUF1552 domain-containing protein [Steroidobacteraceae bacterium]|jgi:hypothetical protein